MSAVPVSGPDWVRDAVFYQVFPDRFAMSTRVRKPGPLEPWDAAPTNHGFKGGDLLGIAEHLDELVDLGITALYLTPIFSSASNHRYHAYDYEQVDPMLGGDEALRELLDQAHRRKVRVVLDGVFNHVGRGFWQFHHILENGGQSPYRDWFHLDPDVLAGRRHLVAYPGARPRRPLEPGVPDPCPPDDDSLGYRAWWDLPALPKLNHSNPDVREHVMAVAEKWLRFGIDGWRLDVPQEITEAGFWEEFRGRCLAVNPAAYLVGEIWYPAPEWLAGDRFHGLMNYPLTEAILSFVGGRGLDLELVGHAVELGRYVRPVDGPGFGRWLTTVMTTYDADVTAHQLNLLDSHDTPRFVSMSGNRPDAFRLATLVQMTLPGAPCVYYGDEVGLQGGHDPDCRRGFPWDPARQDRSLREFMRGIVALRRDEPLLRHGRFGMLAAEGQAVAYRMAGEDGSDRSIVVALNAGYEPARLRVPVAGSDGLAVRPISWQGSEWRQPIAAGRVEGESVELDLAPRAGSIVEIARGDLMPDLTVAFESPETESAFLAIVDREGKIPAALEDLGPVCDRDVVLLDAGRGFRERELAGLGANVTAVRFEDPTDEAAALAALAAIPEGCADTVVVPWSDLALPGSAFLAAAERLLRARGKLLLIHDYGRDDVWSLWPERRDRVVEWSYRKGAFLGDDFRVRVIHCRWTFESIEQARELLTAGFGDRGAALADEMKRPRLEYQVAVYHRWAPAARASLRYEAGL